MAVTIQDLLNDPRYKDNKSLLLLAKPDVLPPKPRKKKKQKTTRQLIADLQEEQKSTRQLIADLQEDNKTTRQLLMDFIKKQTKFNEFVIKQFKLHGWTE